MACDGSLNPMALVYGLGYATERLGGKIWINTTVTGVRRTVDGRIEAVETDKGCINTTRVVCAAGVWTPEIGRMVGLEIPIKPRQGQILVSERTVFVARRKVAEFGYLAAKFKARTIKERSLPRWKDTGLRWFLNPPRPAIFSLEAADALPEGISPPTWMFFALWPNVPFVSFQ